MKNTRAAFTAVLFQDGDGFVGWCPEVKGTNGQGPTREDCLRDIASSVETMLDYYRAKADKEAPPHAERMDLVLA